MARTCTHDVVSEEGGSEPQRQHEHVAGEAGELVPEACGVDAEVGEGSRHQDSVRVEAKDVVVPGVQICSLMQLQTENSNTFHGETKQSSTKTPH